MNPTPLQSYQRLEWEGMGIYVDGDRPDWFVPNTRTDQLLQALCKGNPNGGLEKLALEWRMTATDLRQAGSRVMARLTDLPPVPYQGRSNVHSLTGLKELWLHLTNRCNMACAHCLFASHCDDQITLDPCLAREALVQAHRLGTRVFCFTGGEPSIHSAYHALCEQVLACPDSHLVILSNGTTLARDKHWLQGLDRERFHLQLSIDGLQQAHDRLRGTGAFAALKHSLNILGELELPATLAMAVTRHNLPDMEAVVGLAADQGVGTVHFQWLFRKGKADDSLFAPPGDILPCLLAAHRLGKKRGVVVDNLENLRSQLFTLRGTRFDLSDAGWESLAIGPEGHIYPSPALILEDNLAAGHLEKGLEQVWRHSPVLEQIRRASLLDSGVGRLRPLRFLTGGGDGDHSYVAGKTFAGHDPYLELQEQSLLYLLAEEAQQFPDGDGLGLRCRMGEHFESCDGQGGANGFTHCNCVLSLPGRDGHTPVQAFYSAAAEHVNEEILNPVHYNDTQLAHIPKAAQVRSYGCGSPVLDCGLSEGETLVDLGSGSGVECFIAARVVGPRGRVFGIDMSPTMLEQATRARSEVERNLGYGNVEFKRGFLERLPLEDRCADVVISNCVINLSPDKRRTFCEILRVLKPGGRICISDIVHPQPVPVSLRYDEKLRGECIGGAMQEQELYTLLEETGFRGLHVEKRFPYREVQGHAFYSVTYSAWKEPALEEKTVLYRGPGQHVLLENGQILERGLPTRVLLPSHHLPGSDFFVLDQAGMVTNLDLDNSCACFTASHAAPEQLRTNSKQRSGCLACGEELEYLHPPREMECVFCGQMFMGDARCSSGHFVCDHCHSEDALQVVAGICRNSRERDLIALFTRIRSHPALPSNGPEYHSLIPAVILSVFRTLGGAIGEAELESALARGRTISGGACAFMGVCGAAGGVGIAFSIILGADPYKGEERKRVQNAVLQVMEKIGAHAAARCCQRDGYLALRTAADLSRDLLGIPLPAEAVLHCTQYQGNRHCSGRSCPLFALRQQ